MSYTQPQTTINEHGVEGKHWRTTGGDLTLYEYLRRDFGEQELSGGWAEMAATIGFRLDVSRG